MANVKITDLTSDTPASGDEIAFHDTSGGDTNKCTMDDIVEISHTVSANWTINGDWTFSGNPTVNSILWINETANANQSIGLTINQGANDDEILALKSSDVAHGVTSETETDTFAKISKASGGGGGIDLRAYRDNGASAGILSLIGSAENTQKSTSATGTLRISAGKNSGTGTQSLGTNGNLVTIEDNFTARFIFDVEGSAHADVEWTTFDDHDDLALIEDMETHLAPDTVKRRFGDVVEHDREFFERIGLLHDVREVGPGRMRGMLNTTKAHMVAFGAIRQVGDMAMEAVARSERNETRTDRLESALREIVEANPQIEGRERAMALLN